MQTCAVGPALLRSVDWRLPRYTAIRQAFNLALSMVLAPCAGFSRYGSRDVISKDVISKDVMKTRNAPGRLVVGRGQVAKTGTGPPPRPLVGEGGFAM